MLTKGFSLKLVSQFKLLTVDIYETLSRLWLPMSRTLNFGFPCLAHLTATVFDVRQYAAMRT